MYKTTLLLLLPISALLAQPSAGTCVSDANSIKSICTPAPVPVKVAAGATYKDANFGAQINILSPRLHQYSGISPLSVNGKYLHTFDLSGTAAILNAATGAVVTVGGNVPYPICHWSNSNDDICYYLASYAPQLMRCHVSTNSSDVLIDYTGKFTGALSDGGTTDISADEWTAFWAPVEHQVCAADLKARATYCSDYLAANSLNKVRISAIDYATITNVDAATGKRYVLLFGDPSMAIYSVDTVHKVLTLEARPESGRNIMGDTGKNNYNGICEPGEGCPSTPHGSVFQAPDGKQYFAYEAGFQGQLGSQYVCALDLVTVKISAGALAFTDSTLGGGTTRIRTISDCGTTWQSYHLGCARLEPVCVLSMDAAAYAVQDGNTPYFNELMLVSFAATTPVITPLAMHHSTESQYWAQPRAALSFKGDKAIFDSDFGGSTLYVAYASTGVAATGSGDGSSTTPVLGASCGSGLQFSVDSVGNWLYVCGGGRWGRAPLQF